MMQAEQRLGNGELVLGVDASTTACKAIVFDSEGRQLAQGRAAIGLANPEPDGYEQDAEEWWTAALGAIRQALSVAGREAGSRIRAIGLAHQRETFVLTDSECRPLHPALVWMDARCKLEVADAAARFGASALHALSGKPPSTTPSFYKLAYLLKRRPDLLGSGLRVLDVGGFLSWRLTGLAKTSLASADPLGLVDMQQRCWSEALLSDLRLGSNNVSGLLEPGQVLGTLRSELARDLGLAPHLPVVAGAGDGQAAGLGAGIVTTGRAYLNLGTAIVSGVLSPSYRIDRAFRTLYGAQPGTFFLETDLKGGTFTLDWLAEKWCAAGNTSGRTTAAILGGLEAEAARLPPAADGLLVVPYWNGVMNPYWDDDATGISLGWHGAHGPAHFYRAVLEGVALEQRLHLGGVEASTEAIQELAVLRGGAQSRLWCQILADVLKRPVRTCATHEATALGAAMLACVGVGIHGSCERAAAAMTRTGDVYESGSAASFYDDLYGVYAGLYPSLASSLGALARLRSLARIRRE